ncbi:hypothetical protein TNCV_4934471 [Trichonephila clavipes]|nr:hypothetical protein TNCV_4934471 [Trichonephila clavipes]
MPGLLKLEEALGLFNGINSNENDVEIVLCYPPDARKLTDDNERDKNEVNIGILLLTPYLLHTCERSYWSDGEDLGITLPLGERYARRGALPNEYAQTHQRHNILAHFFPTVPHTEDVLGSADGCAPERLVHARLCTRTFFNCGT